MVTPEIERRVMQLQIEREALRKESDAASKDRLAKLDKELADLKEQHTQLQAHWEQEKSTIQAGRSMKEALEQVRLEIEQAQRAVDGAVIAGERYRHHRHEADAALAIFHRTPFARTHRKNSRVRRIDDRRELAHTVHAEIRDGARPATPVARSGRCRNAQATTRAKTSRRYPTQVPHEAPAASHRTTSSAASGCAFPASSCSRFRPSVTGRGALSLYWGSF